MAWTEWRIDRSTNELVGPCGCRLPNGLDGVKSARGHVCSEPRIKEG